MELGLITQYTQVNDAADIKLTGTSWYPKNSGGGNYGVITIREALQRSLNTVSAQILDKASRRAHRMSSSRISSALRALPSLTATTRRSPSASSPMASPCAR